MTDDDRLTDLLMDWEKRSGDTEIDPDTFCARRGAGHLSGPFRKLLSDLGLFGMAASRTEQTADGEPITVDFAAGRFRAQSVLGQGGLGVVFRALDGELERPVALKRLHAGDLAFERFVFEARLTGRLEHPGIVPIYGLVAERSGEVCYAMRLITGVTLNDAIAKLHQQAGEPASFFSSSEMRRLLRAFVTACETVAFAHSKHVVHRDLKPQNIMLGEFGECLVIDWGLARVLGEADSAGDPHLDVLRRQLAADNEQTVAGQAKGTWAYMSPEQARGEWDRVGPASDIFSLGATLYKLLTGQSPYHGPFDPDAVKAGKFPAPRSIKANLPKPLEAVVTKAMAADAANRYTDARELAQDVERWLADEPVTAYRDALATRARRWAKRHRMFVASTAVLIAAALVALTAGLILLTGKNRVIARERDRAAKSEAEALAINTFFRDQVLAAPRPRGRGPGRDIRLAEALDQAVAKIPASFADQPLVEADVRHTLGETYLHLGRNGPAAEQLQRAYELRLQYLGLEHAKTLASLNNWANAVREGGDSAKAIDLYRSGLNATIKVHGPDGRDTIAMRGNLGTALRMQGRYPEAEAELRPALDAAKRVFGLEHEITRTAMNDLALTLLDQGKHAEAEPIFLEALEIESRVNGPEEPESLAIRHNIGLLLLETDRPLEAEKLFRTLVESRRRVQGPDHADTLKSAGSWAESLVHLGRIKEAEPIIRDSYERAAKALGADHADTLTHGNNLGMVQIYLGKPELAEKTLRDVWERRKRSLPVDHPDTLESQSNLGYCLTALNRPEEAVAMFQNVTERARRVLPDGHRLRLTCLHNWAGTLVRLGRYAEAEPLLRESADASRRLRGIEHDHTLNAVSFLAMALAKQGKAREAEPLYREVYDMRRKRNGTRDEDTLKVAMELGETLQTLGRARDAVSVYRDVWEAKKGRPENDNERQRARTYFASMLADAGEWTEAEELARANLAAMMAAFPAGHPQRSGAQSLLGGVLLDQKKFADAEPLLRESLTAREKSHPPGHWQIALSRVRLGACLAGLKQYADAEKLLLQGQRESTTAKDAPAMRQTEAIRRLVTLYESWGKSDEAARWRKELPKDE